MNWELMLWIGVLGGLLYAAVLIYESMGEKKPKKVRAKRDIASHRTLVVEKGEVYEVEKENEMKYIISLADGSAFGWVKKTDFEEVKVD